MNSAVPENFPPPVRAALERIVRETGSSAAAIPADDAAMLARASRGDSLRLDRWLKRRLAGEPLAYIVGEFTFRGRRFQIDKRAYITDPEASFLVDSVLRQLDAFAARHGRPAIVAEMGCGCGSLGLSLKLERPGIRLIGLDLDPDPLVLAAANAAAHGVEAQWIESDLFAGWPLAEAPDLIFGDPPWGSEQTLYDTARDAAYYHAMPAASAFPLGGPMGCHAQILAAVSARGWSSHVVLNGGVLPALEFAALAQAAAWRELEHPVPEISILHCRMH